MKHDFFGWFPRKIPGATKHLKRLSGFSRRNSVWVNGTQNSGLVNFVHLPCTNLRFIRSTTVIFFADSNRFRVHQAKFEPNTWGRPILMAQSIPSIPFTNPPPPPPSPGHLQLSAFQNKMTNARATFGVD